MVSRLLGLVREQIFAGLLGAGPAADAFVVAFRIPNLLRDLFAEGALSSAFVPTFTDTLRNRSQAEAYALANRLLNTLTLLLAVLVGVAEIFAVQVVHAVAGNFPEEQVALAAELTRIMLPFLPLVSLAAVAMGMLTSQGKFTAPALASTMFNVASIIVGGALYLTGAEPHSAVVGWSVGTLLGGLAQFLVQVPPLWKSGWRPALGLDLRLRDPGMRRVAKLMGPAVVGLAATQVNIVVNTYFASSVPGAPAWLSFAFRLMQLPLGVFGVAIGTVATASIAASYAARDMAGVGRTVGAGLRLVAFFTVPSTVALAVLGEPIIRLIYEHGRFLGSDTRETAVALGAYAVGLYAYSGVKLLAPVFYALDRPRIPLLASVSAVCANLVLNILLFPWGFWTLALGTSVAALTNFFVLTTYYRRSGGTLAGEGVLAHLGRVGVASLLAGAGGWTVAQAAGTVFGHAGVAARLIETGGGLGAGGALYLVACHWLRVAEVRAVTSRLLARLTQRR